MNNKCLAMILILMVGVLAGCLRDEDIKQQKQTHRPEQLNDGWEISSPASEGFDSGKIDEVYEKFFSEALYPTENLFTPLGINHYQWETHADGRTFGAFGLWLKPRDMAKIGKLMIQKGNWNGQQIVSEEWVTKSTGLQTPFTYYGYYWLIYPDYQAFSASGFGGQKIFVVQKKSLVVVLTADSYSSSAALSPGLFTLIKDIMDAILD